LADYGHEHGYRRCKFPCQCPYPCRCPYNTYS
jgi:hypothetical protein